MGGGHALARRLYRFLKVIKAFQTFRLNIRVSNVTVGGIGRAVSIFFVHQGAAVYKWSVKPIGLEQPMGCKRQSLR